MSALRKAIEAAIAAVGRKANAEATVQGRTGPKRPLYPTKSKKTEHGYTLEHKKAMEAAGAL